MTRALTILVAEDSQTSRQILLDYIHLLGHTAVAVSNGQEAVEYCSQHRPDVIFMDVTMPVMDGFTATMAIRQQLGEHWIPIIFLTSLSDRTQLLRGLSMGGDDYLTKPIDLDILTAKLHVLIRISEMQQRIASDSERLEAYYRANEQEQMFAQMVLDRFTRRADQIPPNIQQWQRPAMNFSGDTICIRRCQPGLDRIMLADSTGHGLAAAICGLPAVDTFFAMCDRNLPVQEIVRTINRKLHTILPIGRFVAAAVIEVDYLRKRIAIWNGGIPCAIFVDKQGQMHKSFRSSSPPLGILPDADFESTLDYYNWENSGALIVCSDGITEAYDHTELPFGIEGILKAVSQAKTQDIQGSITHAVNQHLGGQENHDDISLVVVRCP